MTLITYWPLEGQRKQGSFRSLSRLSGFLLWLSAWPGLVNKPPLHTHRNHFLLLSTWHLDTLKPSATSEADWVFRLLTMCDSVCGWSSGLLSEVGLSYTWRSGVQCGNHRIFVTGGNYNLWLVESLEDRSFFFVKTIMSLMKLWTAGHFLQFNFAPEQTTVNKINCLLWQWVELL